MVMLYRWFPSVVNRKRGWLHAVGDVELERTKHHYHRFAASVGYMDWATQPDPFRRYEGASLVRLPFSEMGQALPYWLQR
jgi:hypothetical protein